MRTAQTLSVNVLEESVLENNDGDENDENDDESWLVKKRSTVHSFVLVLK